MADYMEFPLHVLPMRTADADRMNAEAFIEELDLFAATRCTDRERGELRRMAVAVAAEVMRDCDDHRVRATAYNVLLKLKVVRP